MLKVPITKDEILYRRVPSGRKLYKRLPDGSFQIEAEAFDNRDCRISVDRAELCNNDPLHTLGESDGGVVSLLTLDVRSIEGLKRNDSKGRVIQTFTVDVEHMPIPENSAHAEIHGIPEFTDTDQKGSFRRLRYRLAQLAEARQWEIKPERL